MHNHEIDLLPREWKSDRAKPREPIFGPGVGPFLAEMVVLAVTFGLIFLAATLGKAAYSAIESAVLGEPHHAQPLLRPGETAVINGVTIRRIN
jgi:hypothetical protein